MHVIALINSNLLYPVEFKKTCTFRWGKRPVDEAETFRHMQVVEYLNNYALAHKTELENKQNECIDDENDSCHKPSESTVQSPLPWIVSDDEFTQNWSIEGERGNKDLHESCWEKEKNETTYWSNSRTRLQKNTFLFYITETFFIITLIQYNTIRYRIIS